MSMSRALDLFLRSKSISFSALSSIILPLGKKTFFSFFLPKSPFFNISISLLIYKKIVSNNYIKFKKKKQL